MERICLKAVRSEIDDKYVGFYPNGTSVKPVHIAEGIFRCVDGRFNKDKDIKRLALVSGAKGNIPKGNEIDTVYENLLDNDEIEDSISKSDLEAMRNIMQKLLSADGGAYVVEGLKDSMLSYSAGSKYFLTAYSIYEDAGELIGSIVEAYCPELTNYIKNLLDEATDPITLLFMPVLDDNPSLYDKKRYEELPAFKHPKDSALNFVKSIKSSGECLLDNLRNHINPLTQLRLFNLYCIFNLMRYMSLLEAFYCDGTIRPILLDFSGKAPSQSSVARSSEISYTQMYKSLNRFYAYEYSKWLEDQGYLKQDLLNSETPRYTKTQKPSKDQDELDTLWELAKERANDEDAEDVYMSFGETMYDMLALEGNSSPVNYLKALGTKSGILYPPDSRHPNKRFVLSQDILEMLVMSSVRPGEIIGSDELRQRLWNRFGIIVGGGQFEMTRLQDSGMILQTDERALEDNFHSFANALESMDFAEIMADGILQIRIGGNGNDR